MEEYLEAVRVCNKEHKWMRWYNAFQGMALTMENLRCMLKFRVRFGVLTGGCQIADNDGGEAGYAVEPLKDKVGVQTSWYGVALMVE